MNLLANNPGVEAFFKWWLSEFSDMLPNVSFKPAKNNHRGLNIVLTGHGYQLRWDDADKAEKSINDFSSAEAQEIYDRAIDENKKFNVQKCNILLHEKLVLNRVVTLPLATEENLENVFMYEIDRYTPFKREDVYFDTQVQSRNTQEKKITVLLRVAKKHAMREVLSFLDENHIRIGKICCVDEDLETIGEALSFGGTLNSASGKSNHNSTNKYLLALTAGLAVIALTLPIAKNYWNAFKYDAELENINHEVIEVRKSLAAYKKIKNNIDLSASLNKNNAKVIVLLNELTSTISDDTSLNRLSIEDGVVRMQGASSSASRLVSSLDSSQTFTDVRFAAPVTQNSATGSENFTIEMKLNVSGGNDESVR